VENSTEGTVNNTLDMFITSPLKICGEIELRIHQNLIGRMRGVENILRVCSHQQSLAQCRHWLDEHLSGVERLAVSSNAEAARRARDEDGTAAIAGQAAAEVYGLNIIVPEIEDTEDNTTRFLVIGRKLFAASGKDKTTLLLSAGDTQSPGTLHRLLEPLARNNISMTRIESRPSRRRKWDYVFFIDVFGHAEEPPLKQALDDLKKQSSLFRVLGSYPCAVL
jgi:chorismate mutase/prephenate dehydratase